ncbi:MAG: 4'-phosphopantetheinyl transferase superfamily protein [Chloroflexi bacterium]|nr:4'-phosphopantetheinyl transferase superfamily protein [Chloroflexota bacterium]
MDRRRSRGETCEVSEDRTGLGDVHLWWGWLDASEPAGDILATEVLSLDERERAARFHFARDQQRFILARGMLRHVLARYVCRRAQDITFQYLSHGKPRLADSGDIEFNLAHSHDLVLCAVSRAQVGVDVERLQPVAEIEQLARMTFSPAEQAALFALEPDQRLLGFFNGWTRKEAYVKARGDGLAMRLDAFDVSLKPGEPAALLDNRLDPNEVARWSLAAISPAEGYVAAVAAPSQGINVCVRQWEWLASL